MTITATRVRASRRLPSGQVACVRCGIIRSGYPGQAGLLCVDCRYVIDPLERKRWEQ